MDGFQKILADLGSIHWWFTAFLFAVIVNLISNRADRVLGRWVERFSNAVKTAGEAERARLQQYATRLSTDPIFSLRAEIRLQGMLMLLAISVAVALGGAVAMVVMLEPLIENPGAKPPLIKLVLATLPGVVATCGYLGAAAALGRLRWITRGLRMAARMKTRRARPITGPASPP